MSDNLKPKRTFVDCFPNGGMGSPYHIVVQYREDGSDFMCAEYFPDYESADLFIEEIEDE